MANLWARGAALQCCFNQESIDFLIPVYFGSVAEGEVFDPSCLSAVAGQVKYKSEGSPKAGDAIGLFGASRHPSEPLPYLALLMELGNESKYQETKSRIKLNAADALVDGKFPELTQDLIDAVNKLKSQKEPTKKMKAAVQEARLAVNSYNRYLLCVRGASELVYGVLREAHIDQEFHTLLKVTMVLPTDVDHAIQYMRPLERLGDGSLHTAWMSEYVVGGTDTGGDKDVNMG